MAFRFYAQLVAVVLFTYGMTNLIVARRLQHFAYRLAEEFVQAIAMRLNKFYKEHQLESPPGLERNRDSG